jgi:uroporphyrinogen decarboxylase
MTKKLLRALQGEVVWPPPVWLMRQAGRYLPEYRAIRARTGDFIALCTNPDLASEVTLQPVRRFGMDGTILFSDILILPWALGQGLEYREGEGPVLPPIRDEAGLARLDSSKLLPAIAPIQETVRKVAAQVGASTLIGFAGAPFTVACYMVEGHGSKEFGHVREMAYGNPALFGRLMDLVTETTITYLSAQIEAGAEAVMLFDSWAGVLSPALFEAHCTKPAARIVAALKQMHPDVPFIGFPRLAGTKLASFAERTGVQGLGMDTAVDPVVAAATVPRHVALQGNVDPLALVAGGSALANEAASVLAAMRDRPFIFNLGHGVVPHTSPDHVAALVAQVRAA